MLLQYATLNWKDGATPESAAFGDVYFSRGGGRAETEYVFLGGCGLPEGWNRPGCYRIGETGFGTGLNFLHSWQRFLATAPRDAALHYLSVEAFPLSPADLARALAGWEGEEAASLLAYYPLPVPGWHRMRFGRVTLTLGFGDATALLRDTDASIDAWYLDGFAPAKNVSMWQEALYDEIARLSHEGTRLASFTAAGEVRRGLAARGFAIERRPGFGRKRHAINGVYTRAPAPRMRPAHETVAVIGAGIAGVSAAYALARQGMEVTLYDAAPQAASAASGNPAAVLYPQMTQHYGSNMAWHMGGFAHTVRALQHAPYAALTGMLKTPKDEREESRLRAACARFEPEVVRWVDAEEASALLGVKIPRAGAWFCRSGWVDPRAWCAAWLQQEPVVTRYDRRMDGLVRKNGYWQLRFAQGGSVEVRHAVLANAAEAARLYPALQGDMRLSAGQISLVPAGEMPPLQAVLCHKGYSIPTQTCTLIGATYAHDDLSEAVTQENHAKNAEETQHALPGCTLRPTPAWQGRTALRASTRDRLPLVGRLEEGLYITAGHGSRGMVSAPLAGELIASLMTGDILPVSRSLAASVDPLRFARKREG